MADNETDREWQLFERLLESSETYHSHKETMAHTGLAVQIGLLVALISASSWPPGWVPEVNLSSRAISVIGFVIVWLLIHIFVRWQLRDRRAAAIVNAALLQTLKKRARESSQSSDSDSRNSKQRSAVLLTFCDYLFPCASAPLHYDVGKEGYPEDFVKAWNEQEKAGTGAIKSEWFLWVGSLLVLGIGLVRTLRP